MEYVYKFTNGRRLTKTEFIKWFQKKFLYINRKFQMIKKNDIIGFENRRDFRGVVLEELLRIFSRNGTVRIVKLPAYSCSQINKKKLIKNFKINKNLAESPDRVGFGANQYRAKREKIPNKIAIPITLDIEADKAIHILINRNAEKLKQLSPIQGKIIKPICLFSDEEVLLYAKLRGLKFKIKKEKTDGITKFIDGLEKKHPEVKRAIVNGVLKLYC